VWLPGVAVVEMPTAWPAAMAMSHSSVLVTSRVPAGRAAAGHRSIVVVPETVLRAIRWAARSARVTRGSAASGLSADITATRSLLLGSFVKHLVGLRGPDSRAIIGVLQSHVERPENTVRRQWRSGDVAVWDDRATQRYGVDDSGDHVRTLRRVTIDGDEPVGTPGAGVGA